MYNKKGFSFVEIIITIAIVALLAVIWYTSKSSYDNNINNTKVISDMKTIDNALNSYYVNLWELPMPDGNTNFYWVDRTYIHSYDDLATYWVHGFITQDTLPKQYIDIIPLDPRTNSYYAYWRTKDSAEYEISWIQVINEKSVAQVTWIYSAEDSNNSQRWLIREYNGPNFVLDWSSTNLPYNPEELILVAKFGETTWIVEVNWVQLSGDELKSYIIREWDIIETLADEVEIYFSDGSVSVLEMNSKIQLNKLNFKWEDNLATNIKIALWVWKIWTKATSLDDESKFEIYTTDTTAAVRWTIFAVSNDTNNTTEVTVIEWVIEAYQTKYSWLTSLQIAALENENQDIFYIEENYELIPIDYNVDTYIKRIENIINESTWSNYSFTVNEFKIGTSTTIIDSTLTNDISWADMPVWFIDSLTILEYEETEPDEEELDDLAYEKDLEIPEFCNTFQAEGECAIWDVDLISDGYEFVGYAPLNSTDNLFSTWADLLWSTLWSASLSNSNGEDWILVPASWSSQLKYSGMNSLNLWEDFAYEINVLWSDLKRTTWSYYLFKRDNVYLDMYNWYIYLWYNTANNVRKIKDSFLSWLDDDTFYSIIVTFDSGSWGLKVRWEAITDIDSITAGLSWFALSNEDYLSIWVNGSSNQWDWLINYIKIYKK